MARTDPQSNIRLPSNLKERLVESAKENKRTFGAEVVARLESSFEAAEMVAAQLPFLEKIEGALDEVAKAAAKQNARIKRQEQQITQLLELLQQPAPRTKK